MNRATLLTAVARQLGERRLVWFGTRGDDIESIADLEQLDHAFSLIAPYKNRSSVQSLALEDLSGRRIDLDTFELDDHPRSPAVVELRHALLRALARPSAIFTYRPSSFVSAVAFARQERCRHLGMFKDHQAAFEHKPWVESSLAELGVPGISWTYVADEDQLDTLGFLADGPVMLRRSRTTGGVGLTRVDDSADLASLWPDEDEAYVSVAPFLGGGIPVNVGAVAWHDGVTVHPASLQLIGIEGLTDRPFGYCGNDFGAAADLGPELLAQIELSVVDIGNWLRGYGYLGTYGVDFLVVGDRPLFLEVNPRFQGSSHLSCQLSVEADESCLMLEHLAAFLGCDAPPSRPLAGQALDHDPRGHMVVHWAGREDVQLDPSDLVQMAMHNPAVRRVDVRTRANLITEAGSAIARITIQGTLTSGGFDLVQPWRALVDGWWQQSTRHARDVCAAADGGSN